MSRRRTGLALRLGVRLANRAPLPPLDAELVRAGGAAIAVCGAIAIAAAAMRVVPLALGDTPASVTWPFARAVVSVALEAALLVAWPVGWALGAFAIAERGEARVLELLGRSAAQSVARAIPIAILFASALAASSLAGGRDASEPGRVATELVNDARDACAQGGAARATPVPLIGATWLCDAGDARLVAIGSRFGTMGGYGAPSPTDHAAAIVTAKRAAIAADAREVTLDDAWLAIDARTTVHVGHAVFHLPPFVRASPLRPAARAIVLAGSGLFAALASTWLVLLFSTSGDVFASSSRGDSAAFTRVHAFFVGASGPVTALVALRALDAMSAPGPAFFAVPLASLVGVIAAAWAVKTLPRLLSAGTS